MSRTDRPSLRAMRLQLDDGVRRSKDGRTLIGGSPFAIRRLSARRSADLDALLAGGDAPADVRRTLMANGVIQPLVDPLDPSAAMQRLVDVDLVIASRDNGAGVVGLLQRVPTTRFASVTVVDDGSVDPILESSLPPGVGLITHDPARGPAEARNRGAAAGTAPTLLFLDDDITFGSTELVEVLASLLPWFDLDDVGAVAPRVRTSSSGSVLGEYEADRGVFDLGPAAARVAPGTRVSYVPTALLAVRRSVFEAVGGFDADRLRGEDVDLVWRIIDAGWIVRYEPSVEIEHPVRPTLGSWLRQRHRYGRSTSELGAAYPEHVAALEISPWSAAAWLLVLSGGPASVAAGLLTWAGSTLALVPQLRGLVDEPAPEAIRIAGGGTLHAGVGLGPAVRRSWAPVLLLAPGATLVRRAAVVAWIVGPALEWRRSSRRIGLVRWLVLRALDDGASCLGVWHGAATSRSMRALAARRHGGEGLVIIVD